MNLSEPQSTAALVANGSVASVMVIIAHDTVYRMLPYLIVCLVVIVMDLYYGVKAARKREETVRVSRAIRRTLAKVFEYLCWIVIGSALAVAFEADWLDKAVVGSAMFIECLSLITNALFCKGYKISGLEKAMIKKIGEKHNIDTSEIQIEKENEKGD